MNEEHKVSGKTILLVDDQPVPLLVMQDALEAGGHQVFIAYDGREALALYGQHQDEVDLLITDMQMPAMDGAALVSAIRVYDGSLPILIISGYFSPQLEKMAEVSEIHWLLKPFGMAQLLEVVRKILTAE